MMRRYELSLESISEGEVSFVFTLREGPTVMDMQIVGSCLIYHKSGNTGMMRIHGQGYIPPMTEKEKSLLYEVVAAFSHAMCDWCSRARTLEFRESMV
jgi:hypothetical protein